MASVIGTASPRGRSSRKLPLTPFVPLIIALLGLGAAAWVAVLGSRSLQEGSDLAAQQRSRVVAGSLAARVGATPAPERAALLERTATRLGVAIVLFDARGRTVAEHGAAPRAPQNLRTLAHQATGITVAAGRRQAFTVQSLEPPAEALALAVFLEAPRPAAGTLRMMNSVGVLTALLLAVAIAVSLAVMGATGEDLRRIRTRIADLARPRGPSRGVVEQASAVPLRSFDQVGILTAALNSLVGRFAEAERGYRQDLEEASRINRERSEFLAGLSHELRTPLNAILGFAHLLETDAEAPLDDEARDALRMIRASGEHLRSLIDDILDLSAAETGELRLSRTVFDLRSLAEDVVREARGTVGPRPVVVRVDAGARAFTWADARRMRQVLTNLVSNAIKATAEGEVCVRVDARPDEGVVVVSVSDTGRGIDAASLAAVFEPYRQVGEELTRRGGVGLGLAIARQLVLLHGGTIDATSTVGRGSEFVVRVPDDSAEATLPRDSVVPWSDEPPGPEPSREVLSSRAGALGRSDDEEDDA